MPNPVTHILFGYAISKKLVDKKKLVFFGVVSSLLVDLDGLHIPGLAHHGVVHTPFFIGLFCLAVFLFTRSKLLVQLCMMNMVVHIGLDTVATTIPVMWFYPFSTYSFAVGGVVSLAGLYVVKLVVFMAPLIYLVHKYLAEEIDPVGFYHYIRDGIGEVQTYALFVGFSALVTYIWIVDYALEVL